jgi:hypothetical protein
MKKAQPVFGWVDDPAAREKSLDRLAIRGQLFEASFQPIRGSAGTQDVFFWEAEQKVLNKLLPSWNQGQVGSCVSHGWGRAVQDLLLVEVANGEPEQWPGFEVCREAIYGGSRVEIGGGRLGNEDGSMGSWAADFVTKYGNLFYQKYPSVDLTGGYTERRAKDWGYKGVPDDLESACKEHPVGSVAKISSAQSCADAIVNGYPVSVCSQQGFAMQRSAGGWCRAQGSWPHCMEIRGVFVEKGGRKGFVIQNSWGDYLGSGNNTLALESGRSVTLPEGCFAAEWDVVDRMCRQDDTFAPSQFKGFPRRLLDWVI